MALVSPANVTRRRNCWLSAESLVALVLCTNYQWCRGKSGIMGTLLPWWVGARVCNWGLGAEPPARFKGREPG